MQSDIPELLHFKVSHYNEKVRWALDWKRIPHTRRALVPGFHIPTVRLLTGQNKVPVLKVGKEIIHDSSRIIAYLEEKHPSQPLYPSEPEAKKRALAIEDYFDEEVAPVLRRLFWSAYFGDAAACTKMATNGFPSYVSLAWRAVWPLARIPFKKNMGASEENIQKAKQSLGSFFARLESEIGKSGYLVGDSFTVADLTAAAVMTAIIRPPEFPYPLPEPWPNELVDIRHSVAHRAGFQWVLEIYQKHRGTSSEVGRPKA